MPPKNLDAPTCIKCAQRTELSSVTHLVGGQRPKEHFKSRCPSCGDTYAWTSEEHEGRAVIKTLPESAHVQIGGEWVVNPLALLANFLIH